MTTTPFSISRSGNVTDRATGHDLGVVRKINWPVSTDGVVRNQERWEAREPHQALQISEFSFGSFATRAEAARALHARAQ